MAEKSRGATRALIYFIGHVCWAVTAVLALVLVTGAMYGQLTAAQVIVMLAAAVGLGWYGHRLINP